MQKTKIVFLGTGTPIADPKRFGPSIGIIANDFPYLIDSGPGIVRRISAVHEAGIECLKPENLCKLFLTHLHSDHTLGLPDLIFSPWVLGREKPLEVYGPSGTKEMATHLLSAYKEDIKIRTKYLEPSNKTGFAVNVHEIKQGIIFQDDNIIVEAFLQRHGPWKAYGYKFATPDRIIVISGDTAPTDEQAETYKGCDVLIHEVYSIEGVKKLSPEWQRYHANMHTSTSELAKIASAVKPKLLILYHQLFWGISEKKLLTEIQEKYNGDIISARDLEVY